MRSLMTARLWESPEYQAAQLAFDFGRHARAVLGYVMPIIKRLRRALRKHPARPAQPAPQGDLFDPQPEEDAMNDQEIEQEIQDKGLTAPRITPRRIEEVIVGEQYHVFHGTTLTVCCLALANGFTVTGESACASPENFDEDLGRKIARDNAKQKIWALEGYALRNQLAG